MTDQPVLRDPCPRCESSPALIPRHLMGEHVATVHPEVLDPADLTGYLAPDPPIGCLGVAAEHPSEPKQPGTDADWPSRRTGLRDQLAAAIHRYDNHHALSGNDLPSRHHRGEADAVLALLYREWPWLQAEAEELDQARAEIDRLEAELADYDERAERLAAVLVEILAAFHPVRTADQRAITGHTARVTPEQHTRWTGVLGQPKEQL